MIDKNSEEWARAPYWVRIALWGVTTRKSAIYFETGAALAAICLFIVGLFYPPIIVGVGLFGSSYWYAAAIRWADNASLWKESAE